MAGSQQSNSSSRLSMRRFVSYFSGVLPQNQSAVWIGVELSPPQRLRSSSTIASRTRPTPNAASQCGIAALICTVDATAVSAAADSGHWDDAAAAGDVPTPRAISSRRDYRHSRVRVPGSRPPQCRRSRARLLVVAAARQAGRSLCPRSVRR